MTGAWRGEALRFVASGAFNTALTYALYLFLLRWLDYNVAYTIVVLVGVGLAYGLNVVFVFKVRARARTMVVFPLIYAIQYIVGLIALNIAVKFLSIPDRYALLASVTCTVPLTFALSRILLKRKAVGVHE